MCSPPRQGSRSASAAPASAAPVVSQPSGGLSSSDEIEDAQSAEWQVAGGQGGGSWHGRGGLGGATFGLAAPIWPGLGPHLRPRRVRPPVGGRGMLRLPLSAPLRRGYPPAVLALLLPVPQDRVHGSHAEHHGRTLPAAAILTGRAGRRQAPALPCLDPPPTTHIQVAVPSPRPPTPLPFPSLW